MKLGSVETGRGFGVITAAVFCLFLGSEIVAAELVVNGDFESNADTFVTWPGYVGDGGNPPQVPDWTGTGGRGINPINDPAETRDPAPFRDNGNNDTSIAFLQGTATLEQVVTGFIPGNDYVLSLDFNSRNCCGDFPVANVSLNDIVVGSSEDLFPAPGAVPPVGDANPWYHADIPFTAPVDTITLRISSAASAGGDATLIVDNISIVPEPSTMLLAVSAFLGALLVRRRRM